MNFQIELSKRLRFGITIMTKDTAELDNWKNVILHLYCFHRTPEEAYDPDCLLSMSSRYDSDDYMWYPSDSLITMIGQHTN